MLAVGTVCAVYSIAFNPFEVKEIVPFLLLLQSLLSLYFHFVIFKNYFKLFAFWVTIFIYLSVF